jgi:hypothetical protein
MKEAVPLSQEWLLLFNTTLAFTETVKGLYLGGDSIPSFLKQ